MRLIDAVIHPLEAKLPLRVLAILSALALVFAFISQYVFGLHPCDLCYVQRIAFYAVVGLGCLTFLTTAQRYFQAILLLCSLLLLGNAVLASYHTGVEQKWWAGPTDCTTGLSISRSADDLYAQIMAAPVVRCDEPAILWFGFLSMAAANAIFCLLLAFYGMWSFYHVRSVR